MTSTMGDKKNVSLTRKEFAEGRFQPRILLAPMVVKKPRKWPIAAGFVEKPLEHEIAAGKLNFLWSRVLPQSGVV
jgi:hypothetical protein